MSEFRQDIVSGDWIIIAPERMRRPHDIFTGRKKRVRVPKHSCPFENLEKSGNWPFLVRQPQGGRWEVVVVPNKYPALTHDPLCVPVEAIGPYSFVRGSGHHDLVVTRDHDKNFSRLTVDEAVTLFTVIQQRYRMLGKDDCLTYASFFFNWGPTAGASVYHPHYQILTLPIIPPDIEHSLDGARNYSRKHGECVHCTMVRYERRMKTRVIVENKGAIAFAPYASRQPFEVRVFPKRHETCFEYTPRSSLRSVAEALQSVLRRIKTHLQDPDLNFFIHTAPLKHQRRYAYYHWHIEVLPKISVTGGFELSTGVEINVVSPEKAAAILRGKEKEERGKRSSQETPDVHTLRRIETANVSKL